MLFNSWQFLCFFPIVTAFYFFTSGTVRQSILFIAGCYFYMAFVPKYILILFLLIGIDYFAALKIHEQEGKRRKAFLTLSLLANIGVLAFFKYANFFMSNIAALAHQLHWNYSPQLLEIALPLGLSFHTFQSMSYTIEVYYGRQKPERNLLTYALYVMFYPQLVAGPIERPQDLIPQLHQNHKADFENILSGSRTMFWGFFKKMFIADRLAKFVNSAYMGPLHDSGQSLDLIVATYFFAFQIYCDFSGYTDIARGAAQIMGINLTQNFNYPYSSRSVGEFWRRWHISLSSWFRDYLYIPLGGNRVSGIRHYFNLLFVFLVSGFWHGANWTFVIWGGLHGLYIAVSNATESIRLRFLKFSRLEHFPGAHAFLEKFFVFQLVALAWIFFRANAVQDAFQLIKIIFHLNFTIKEIPLLVLNNDTVRTGLLGLMILFAVERMERHKESWRQSLPRYASLRPYYVSAYCALLLVLILAGAPLNEDAFIYFQF